MKRGFFVRKIWFGQSECCGRAVRYYLVAEDLHGLGEIYGVQVEYGGETETVPDITSSQKHAEILLKAMARGSVTPVTAREVVDDWLNG